MFHLINYFETRMPVFFYDGNKLNQNHFHAFILSLPGI